MSIIFGKKCPSCRTKNFFPQHNKSWPCQLPGVRYYTCSDCRQNFFFILPCSILDDKRISERIELPNTLLVRIRGKQQQFGRIEDISMEGMGFSYDLDLQKFARESFTIDIYNCKLGTYLKNLPVQVVSSRVSVKKISGQPITILRNGVRFGPLNSTQKKILKNFIEGFNKKTK